MPAPSQNKFILTIAEAIAHKEGFYAQGSNPSKRNNNPGNLRNWDASLPKDESGFTEFPSRTRGFAALYRQIEKNIVERELTLNEFFAGKEGVYGGYAPRSDNNDPFAYAKYVEAFLEDRGFYPISIDHNLKHWWEDIGGGGMEDPFIPKIEPEFPKIITSTEIPTDIISFVKVKTGSGWVHGIRVKDKILKVDVSSIVNVSDSVVAELT